MTEQSDPRPVRVRLDGHEHDLEVLAEQFATGDPRVELTDNGAVLISSALDDLWQDHPAMHAEAERLMERLNGATVLARRDYEPVRALAAYYGADGSRHGLAVVESMRLRATAQVTVLSGPGPAQPPPPEAPGTLATATRSSDLDKVLRLLSVHPLSTGSMWKIYEIVRANVGGPVTKVSTPKLHSTGWLTPDEFASLREAINNPHVTGEAARHAVHDAPKAAQISVEQARSLLLRLTEQWRATL